LTGTQLKGPPFGAEPARNLHYPEGEDRRVNYENFYSPPLQVPPDVTQGLLAKKRSVSPKMGKGKVRGDSCNTMEKENRICMTEPKYLSDLIFYIQAAVHDS
jgi:hypothetical protein